MGPQCTRISRALDKHPEGVCRVDFLAPNVIDGGLPIVNFPARIHDLIHKHGERIETVGERYGCALYARVTAAAGESDVPPLGEAQAGLQQVPGADTEPALFPAPAQPRSAIFDEDAA